MYRILKHIFLLSILCMLTFESNAQNLLVNGGFEEVNICTEYRVECAPAGWISTSTSFSYYFNDPSLANEGIRCMAVLAGHSVKPYTRTFLRSRLLCGLRKESRYRVEFFIRSRHAILDEIGVLFSDYDILFAKKEIYKIPPSLFLTDAMSKPIKSDTGWQKLTLEYTATGSEVFINFGYFSQKDLKGNTGIPMENNFIFCIDNISMTAVDMSETICEDWRKNRESIYSQHERHQYLYKLAQYYKTNPIPNESPFRNTPFNQIDTLIIPDILFSSSSSVLNSNSNHILDSICITLLKKKCDSLIIEGHTDSTGTLAFNTKLSVERAQSVAEYIGNKAALPKQKITIQSFAYQKPVASNLSEEGRQKNRRVVIYVYSHE